MKTLFPIGIICILLAAACNKHVNTDPVSFTDFIKETKAAKLSDYQGKGKSKVEDEANFREMQDYVLKMYDGVVVKNSFMTADGDIVDCIPFDQQPSIRLSGIPKEEITRESPAISKYDQIQKPDSLPRQDGDAEDITLKPGNKDKYGHAMFCEEGFIPMKRIRLQDLVRYKSLSDFFNKYGKMGSSDSPDESDPSHYYACARQQVANHGGDSWLNVWNPTVASDRMTLSQQWYSGGDGTNKQTLEAGWQVYPNKYDTDKACLFIYSTTGGYQSGTGCYNLDCAGFIQVNNTITLGNHFSNYSSTDGTQWGFNIQWQRDPRNGHWWMFYKGPGDYIAVGYYPHSRFGSGTLSGNAERITFGGEDTGAPSAKQMGSGAKSGQGWKKAAYQKKIFYINTDHVSQWANLNIDIEQPGPDCYDTDVHNIYGNWGTYLFFGGPKCN